MTLFILCHAYNLLLKLSLVSLTIPILIILGKKNFRYWRISSDFNVINFMIGLIGALLSTIILVNWEGGYQKSDYYLFEEPITDTLNIVRTSFPEKKKSPPAPPDNKPIKKENLKIIIQDEIIKEPVDEIVKEEKNHLPAKTPGTESAPVTEIAITENVDSEIVLIAEQMPRFPGCEHLNMTEVELKKCAESQLIKFLYDNLKYPAIAVENKIEGMVILQFVVSEIGLISDVKIVKDIGGGCGYAAQEVVRSMNKLPERWTPGKQRGRPVKVMFTLPVKFKLN